MDTEVKNYIIEEYFGTSIVKRDYPGWRGIAEKLIDTGSCIVAGDSKLWLGGIGNFIKLKPANNAIGCVELFFNLHRFLASEWFRIDAGAQLAKLEKQISLLQEFKNDLKTVTETYATKTVTHE